MFQASPDSAGHNFRPPEDSGSAPVLSRKQQLNSLFLFPLAYYEYTQQADGYTDGELTMRDHFFQMINGGFGSFVMVMMGMGGLATLFITREGKAGKQVSPWGILMVVGALIIFAMRVSIKSGLFGHEYLQW